MSAPPGVASRDGFVVRTARASARIERRSVAVVVVFLLLLAVVAAATLAVGTYRLSVGQVIEVILGGGEERARAVVLELRLPRLVFAVCGGAMLGLAGAILQSITRNPLGSPDIVGLDAGAYTGATLVLLLAASPTFALTAIGSLVGGFATALVVFVLAYRDGLQGFRLVIVGIAVSAMLTSVTSYLFLIVGQERAIAAAAWGAGSLNALTWEQFPPFALAFAVLVPLALGLSRSLIQLEIGDDAARATGLRVDRLRLRALAITVALSASVTAVAGPVTFVALAAPHLAVRITRGTGPQLVASAVMGALLLAAADFIGQRLLVPAGVVTIAIGGTYLIWLLMREYRRA